MSNKNFDIVIYGASGFTGKLVAEYMHKQYGQDESISWAIAGRSKEKLMAVKEAIGISHDVPLLIVDSNNEECEPMIEPFFSGSTSPELPRRSRGISRPALL